MDQYISVNGKKLRCGYTTGTCACGAAMFATKKLLSKDWEDTFVAVDTPAGILVQLEVHNVTVGENFVSCSVIKDGGDDPDITTGMHIYAKVERVEKIEEVLDENPGGVIIAGGEGIGIVTKPGLDQPVGSAAINSTPRKYITEIVESVKKQYGCKDSLLVTISAPEGVELGKKTFNPRMGIEGGISIIGTTGIVEPMSNDAIRETTKLEINQRKLKGEKILYLAPGRIGENFAQNVLGIGAEELVLCSNNIGDAFENAVQAGFQDIVLIGHIGKLVKLGYGAKNTHSANNDGRMEELILCALKAGAENDCLKEIAECVTTDGAITILENAKILEQTMEELGNRIENTLNRWVEGNAKIHLCVFTSFGDIPRILIQRGL